MTGPDGEPRCDYCHAPVSKADDDEEDICKICRKLQIITGGSSGEVPESKPSPMAVDSRGLHEKYFSDGR